jgi:3'-phosphoadenosine 5'-phosphosulfate (PAPS) 3'-phosphatase
MRDELSCAIEVAREAGELVLTLRASFTQQRKADGSVVTNADLASAELIRGRLAARFPADAILTEEDSVESSRTEFARCWIIDPIDGTSAYVSGSDDFDVYIALVENQRPIVVVAHQPVTGRTVFASRSGGAWQQAAAEASTIRLHRPESTPVVVSRHWLGSPANRELVAEYARRVGGVLQTTKGGISPRTFLSPGVDAIVGVSAGEKPISAKEWDVAPLDLIVSEAGGWASDIYGQPLRYNKPQPTFPSGIVLARTPEIGRDLVAAIEQTSTS